MRIVGIGLTLFALSSHAEAEQLSFPEVWKQIDSASLSQESSRLQSQALGLATERSTRHWEPRIYLDARMYQTSDPGPTFIGVLEQRSLKQSDFDPDAINHPDANLFTRAALGMDLPLYEGGIKSLQTELQKHAERSQELATSQIQLEQYAQSSLSFSSIGIIEQQLRKIADLTTEMNRLRKQYELGDKSNPVGYSGLLGLKLLATKLEALTLQYRAQSDAYYAMLKELGLKSTNWTPKIKTSVAFVEQYLGENRRQTDPEPSYHLQSIKEQGKISEGSAKMEEARFRPKVGAFAETYLFNGTRDTANGYTAGIYLQWNIYNPSDVGTTREASLKALAANKYAEATEQQERTERVAHIIASKSYKENIALLTESYKLLLEQSKVMETLFRNGSVNVLQLVEVLNRRSDLIALQGEAELGLLKAASQSIVKERFEIAKHLPAGTKD